MTKKRCSITDIIRENNKTLFVGRAQPIAQFRQALDSAPGQSDFIYIFNIYGQGGVGKKF